MIVGILGINVVGNAVGEKVLGVTLSTSTNNPVGLFPQQALLTSMTIKLYCCAGPTNETVYKPLKSTDGLLTTALLSTIDGTELSADSLRVMAIVANAPPFGIIKYD